jgi:hypothetical protein
VKWSTQTKIYLYPFFEHFIDPKMSIPNNSNSKWLSWNDRFQKTIWKRLVAFLCRRLPSHNNRDAFHSSRIVFVLHRKVVFESSVQEYDCHDINWESLRLMHLRWLVNSCRIGQVCKGCHFPA